MSEVFLAGLDSKERPSAAKAACMAGSDGTAKAVPLQSLFIKLVYQTGFADLMI